MTLQVASSRVQVYDTTSSYLQAVPVIIATTDQPIVILLSFMLVWAIIIIIMTLKNYCYVRIPKVLNFKINPDSDSIVESNKIRKMFNDYLNTFLPIIYDETMSSCSKITRLILLRHSLSALFTSDSRNFNNDYFINYLKGLQISTTITSSMFFLTLLFSLQFPNDDGSCGYNYTQRTCEKRRDLLGRPYCVWDHQKLNDHDDNIYQCIFGEPDFTLTTLLLLTLFQLMLSVPMQAIINIVFKSIVLAPTLDTVSAQHRLFLKTSANAKAASKKKKARNLLR